MPRARKRGTSQPPKQAGAGDGHDPAAIKDAVARAFPARQPVEITLSTGVRLRCRGVPVHLAERLSDTDPQPEPPITQTDAGHDEPNISDPTYLQELEEWSVRILARLSDAFILLGTEIVDVPEGVDRPEDEEWAQRLDVLGIVVRDGPSRYLDWIKLHACGRPDDIAMVAGQVSALTGVSEEDVQRAAGLFPDSAEPGAD